MFEYYAEVQRVVDGDTVDVLVDLGMGVFRSERLRLSRINAWEKFGEHKEKGKLAKQRLTELIPVGTKILIKTNKDKRGKFGRYLAEIYTLDATDNKDLNMNDLMLNEGHAVPYNGGARAKTPKPTEKEKGKNEQ